MNYALISIAFNFVICLMKVFIDFNIFINIKTSQKAEFTGDISPTIYGGQIKNTLIFLSIPILISLALMVLGIVKKNNYKISAFIFLIFTVIYLLAPVGLILALLTYVI